MRIYSVFALPWFFGAILAATWGQSAGPSEISQATRWSSPSKITSVVVAVASRERHAQYCCVFSANAVRTQPRTPLIASVEPDSGKIGDELTVKGNDLGSDSVAALYLTDGKTDVKVPMLAQSATSIRFRIPPEAKPGRFALMVLTKGTEPKLLEQPVKITVEEVGPI